MFRKAPRIEFTPGDRIRIVGRLPEQGQCGRVVSRAVQHPHVYVVRLHPQQGAALFFGDELARDEAPSSSSLGSEAGRARGSSLP